MYDSFFCSLSLSRSIYYSYSWYNLGGKKMVLCWLCGYSFPMQLNYFILRGRELVVAPSPIHTPVLSKQHSTQSAAAAAKSLQSCPTLCDPIDGSPPGSTVPGILQARTLEWVAISFSNVWKWKVKVKSLSCVRLLAIPWTAAHQAPPSMGFSRQEYWSGVPLPSPIAHSSAR